MPIYLYLGTLALNTYTLCVALAALVGGAFTIWQARATWRTVAGALNALLVIGFGALLAGRLGYALLNAAYFAESPAQIISLSSPGYWEHAALAGGLLGWVIARRLSWRISASALVALATLIGIGASVGCIPNGCAYGREVFWQDGWGWDFRVDWADAYLINNPRLPTQLFMAGWLVIVSIVSYVLTRHREAPFIGIWLIMFALGDFAIQSVRADAMLTLAGLRAPQWADMGLAACGTLILLAERIRRPPLTQ
jgi:prolipoprotein diacylglyceryltransferase